MVGCSEASGSRWTCMLEVSGVVKAWQAEEITFRGAFYGEGSHIVRLGSSVVYFKLYDQTIGGCEEGWHSLLGHALHARIYGTPNGAEFVTPLYCQVPALKRVLAAVDSSMVYKRNNTSLIAGTKYDPPRTLSQSRPPSIHLA